MYEAMKKLFFLTGLFLCLGAAGQTLSARLETAYQRFERDSQLLNALSSFYVINAQTGEVVFDRNSTIGMATASTLKIVTAATAYELLGKDFRYETKLGYTGHIKGRTLVGDLYIRPSGDPSLGSWRWASTRDTAILNEMTAATKALGIVSFHNLVIDNRGWTSETIPDGWIWQDIGNYYGAGATGLNWRENQFDIVLRSGAVVGGPVSITKTNPQYMVPLTSVATSAAAGTGDNSYVYYPLLGKGGIVRGTIPVNQVAFTISAADPQPDLTFVSLLSHQLKARLGIHQVPSPGRMGDSTIAFVHYSPPLDSLVYWFLQKSINLYGEALIKTLAYQKNGYGDTDGGVEIVRAFWKSKGIAPAELNIVDGSGLSPLNRVTAHAQVTVLNYARSQPWFNGYYHAIPEYNGMKMKSGTIHDVKSFCGYQRSKDGTEYVFSFLVNNYNGPSASLVRKMYAVLDELKR